MTERKLSNLEKQMEGKTFEERKIALFKRLWQQDMSRVDSLKENDIRSAQNVDYQAKQHLNNRKMLETLGWYDDFLEYGKKNDFVSYTNRVMNEYDAVKGAGLALHASYTNTMNQFVKMMKKRYFAGMSLETMQDLMSAEDFLTEPKATEEEPEEPKTLELHNVTVYTKDGGMTDIRMEMVYLDYGFEQRKVSRIVREKEEKEVYIKVYSKDKYGKEKLAGTWDSDQFHSYESYDSLMRN